MAFYMHRVIAIRIRERFIQDDTTHPVRTGLSQSSRQQEQQLASLHLNYETCEQYPLELVFAHDGRSTTASFPTRHTRNAF